MTYYAKTAENGHQITVKEHCTAVAEMAQLFGNEIGYGKEAYLAGMFHDFGKYGTRFQNVLLGKEQRIDHAICGAAFLYKIYKEKPNWSIVESINGHHDGLLGMYSLERKLKENLDSENPIENEAGKFSGLVGKEYEAAWNAFRKDHTGWKFPKIQRKVAGSEIEQMLDTRMLYSCLVDADYSVSALEKCTGDLKKQELAFDPKQVLNALYTYQKSLSVNSAAQSRLNCLRDELFWQCGEAGKSMDGLCTLTAPTGTGKTLALMHFALQQCIAKGKKRIIVVLPYLSIIQQNASIYRAICPQMLEDHSQSNLNDSEREYAARWSAPIIVTTSVRFFEALFSASPTDCRKLHHIANSVVVFDEAQSLPAEVTTATLQAVQALCQRYHTTVLFSTATQPDYAALSEVSWNPQEILPNNRQFYRELQRTKVEWKVRKGQEVPLTQIADEMSKESSVCAILNIRRHANRLYQLLKSKCAQDEIFFLTTDLCAADRLQKIKSIQNRLSLGKPCRVVATQCIEAGVDFDFDMVYRALAPLDSIIQAAGRCNRNGRIPNGGRVIVFIPDESGQCYPNTWYKAAALKTQILNVEHEIDIHNPEHIQEYYQFIFEDAKDKSSLSNAIKARSYAQVEQAYRLIESKEVRILVPSTSEQNLYHSAKARAIEVGMSSGFMKEIASITVGCFANHDIDLEVYAEPIYFTDRGKHRGEKSGFYLLRPQYECLYSEEMGLQFPEKTQESGNLLGY